MLNPEHFWNGLQIALKVSDIILYDELPKHDKRYIAKLARRLKREDFEGIVLQLRDGDESISALVLLERLRLLVD